MLIVCDKMSMREEGKVQNCIIEMFLEDDFVCSKIND